MVLSEPFVNFASNETPAAQIPQSIAIHDSPSCVLLIDRSARRCPRSTSLSICTQLEEYLLYGGPGGVGLHRGAKQCMHRTQLLAQWGAFPPHILQLLILLHPTAACMTTIPARNQQERQTWKLEACGAISWVFSVALNPGCCLSNKP